MKYEFKGSAWPWFTDLKVGDIYDKERYYIMGYDSIIISDQVRRNLKLASKAPEMFEMLKSVSQGINSMSFDQLELLNDDIEQLLKEATEL